MLVNPDLANANAQTLTLQAFEQIPFFGGPILEISLILFAFSTIIGWAYYADRSVCYLFGNKAVYIWLGVYVLACFAGGAGLHGMAWCFADILNALMAIPNIVLVFLVFKTIRKETKHYV